MQKPKQAQHAQWHYTYAKMVENNNTTGRKKVHMGQIMKECKKQYDNLTAEEKQPYERLAAEDRARYEREMDEYEASLEKNEGMEPGGSATLKKHEERDRNLGKEAEKPKEGDRNLEKEEEEEEKPKDEGDRNLEKEEEKPKDEGDRNLEKEEEEEEKPKEEGDRNLEKEEEEEEKPKEGDGESGNDGIRVELDDEEMEREMNQPINDGIEEELNLNWPLFQPEGEEDLEEIYGAENFWTDILAMDLRSPMEPAIADIFRVKLTDIGMDEEEANEYTFWLKGYEGQLPFGAILTLADNKRVMVVLYDVIMEIICEQNPELKFFTYNMMDLFTSKMEVPKNFSLKGVKLIFFPITYNDHFTLGVVNFEEKIVAIYDSANRPNTRDIKSWAAMSILFLLHKFASNELEQPKINVNEWRKEVDLPMPQQSTDVDCLAFSLVYAHLIAQGKPINFGQKNIAYMRRLFCQKILKREKQMEWDLPKDDGRVFQVELNDDDEMEDKKSTEIDKNEERKAKPAGSKEAGMKERVRVLDLGQDVADEGLELVIDVDFEEKEENVERDSEEGEEKKEDENGPKGTEKLEQMAELNLEEVKEYKEVNEKETLLERDQPNDGKEKKGEERK